MKVSVIAAFTPTPENRGGISALIYALIVHRPKDVDMVVYTYNMNNIPNQEFEGLAKDMRVEMRLVQLPKWYKILSVKGRVAITLSVLLKRQLHTYIKPDENVIKELKERGDSFVWIYPYFFYNYAKALPDKKFIVTGCDCISSVDSTRFYDVFFLRSFKRSLRLFFEHRNSINVEEDFKRPNITMHYVGMQDCLFYKKLHQADNAFFLLHPHYELKDKEIRFNAPKLRVLFAGRYDHYMICETQDMVKGLCQKKELIDLIQITFLGKDWEPVVEQLQSSGYECNHIKWVENYADELINHDVQLTPISNGGGTKGKVLDCIGNGLLNIGSVYALENICVRHNDSCLLYKRANEIPSMLQCIALHKERYEKMAEKGRSQVRKYHDPVRIAKRFFEISSKI